MDRKTATVFLILLVTLFVAIGDRFLPKPLSTASYNTRTALNKSLIGLFPNKKFKNPNQRTEKALEKEEKEGTGN